MLEVAEEAGAEKEGAGASAVLLLLTKVQALLGSAAEVLEVEREELVLLVVGMLLVIPVKIPLTQASLLILSVLDPLLLVMTSLVAVAVLEVNRKDWKLVLHVVVAKLALLTEISLTLALLLLLVLSIPHRYNDCGRFCVFSDMRCIFPAVLAFWTIRQSVYIQ